MSITLLDIDTHCDDLAARLHHVGSEGVDLRDFNPVELDHIDSCETCLDILVAVDEVTFDSLESCRRELERRVMAHTRS